MLPPRKRSVCPIQILDTSCRELVCKAMGSRGVPCFVTAAERDASVSARASYA